MWVWSRRLRSWWRSRGGGHDAADDVQLHARPDAGARSSALPPRGRRAVRLQSVPAPRPECARGQKGAARSTCPLVRLRSDQCFQRLEALARSRARRGGKARARLAGRGLPAGLRGGRCRSRSLARGVLGVAARRAQGQATEHAPLQEEADCTSVISPAQQGDGNEVCHSPR